ncbi:MAG: class I SAM-dependent methyltransferase [Lachnospiraceae bacterium]|nr:class I SAM-dependent methyltransferase [Lachnospiraceae bacterium]
MYRKIVSYLCCPKCRSDFAVKAEKESSDEIVEGILCCENGHVYHISDSVADFCSHEQGVANQWETMSEGQNFEKLDAEMDAGSSQATLEQRKEVLKALVNAVSGGNNKVILDIASGRGMLLAELARNLEEDVQIISADLSAFVLKYDHRKLKKIAPNRKISYLACDATNLPIKDNVIYAATTYGGFSNMLGCAGEGIKEAHRVLKQGGVLADSFVVISKDSKGYEILEQVCAEQSVSGAEGFFLKEPLEKRHRDLFGETRLQTVCEGIGVDNGMDLLPYDGEWYAELVFNSKK